MEMLRMLGKHVLAVRLWPPSGTAGAAREVEVLPDADGVPALQAWALRVPFWASTEVPRARNLYHFRVRMTELPKMFRC